ncbi:MAG TPA: hypothetical protein ENF90_00995 [Candidatus Bathyarchaeota archaeon]|nr:hypothetical protein [Candidatus Bathyarchaeota archaeon]
METLNFKLYCRHCRKIVNVYECHREEKVLPEIKPEFDLITVCCIVCKNPIMKMTKLHKKLGEDKQ